MYDSLVIMALSCVLRPYRAGIVHLKAWVKPERIVQSACMSSHRVPGGNLWVSLLVLDADLSCFLASASALFNAVVASAIIADFVGT